MATEGKTRTLTGYMVFAIEQRSTVEKDNPNLKFADISVELGKRWKALSDAQRAEYNTKGKETVVQVKPKKVKKTKAEAAPATPATVPVATTEVKKSKGKKAKVEATPVVVATPAVVETEKKTKGKKAKAAKTESTDAAKADKPKRGKNAFMYYLDEHRASVKSQLESENLKAGVTDITKKVSEMWKVLTDAQKAPFVEKSKTKSA